MPVNAAIKSRVDAFAKDITTIIQEATIASVQAALGAAPSLAPRSSAKRLSLGEGRARGAKRTPEEISSQTDALYAYIKRNPGQRIEQIAAGMGVTTRELVLPAKNLLSDKKIKTAGVKRATAYSVR